MAFNFSDDLLQTVNQDNKDIRRQSQRDGVTLKKSRFRMSRSNLCRLGETNFTVEDKLLWVDKYQPTSTKDLCIPPRKIKEVQSFITHYPQLSKLMVLIGSPGIGKSTLIRVLAEYELRYNVLQWSDSYREEGQSQLKSFELFLSQAGVYGTKPLLFENNVAEGNSDVPLTCVDSSHNFSSKRRGRRGHGSKAKILRCNDSSKYCTESKKGSLILIDEIPNLHTDDASACFRQVLVKHIQTSNIPTVLIFSNVSEGKHKPEDLERLIDPIILYSPTVQLMQIHAVTKTKMKSCLSKILQSEFGRNISSEILDEYHAMSRGDLRHAIMSLQFQIGAKTLSQKSISNPERRKQQFERDSRLSIFHALGKILYAKRQTESSDTLHGKNDVSLRDTRPPLQFVPEKVMEESDMEPSRALYFLGHNAPAFFTDISELSDALDHLSDSAALLEKKYDGSNDPNFPLRYVASLAGRTVADANKNPTPNTFRQIQPPGIFDVTRQRREMNVTVALFRNRLSRNGFLSKNRISGSSDSFAAHEFPFINQILPNEVSHTFGITDQPTENDQEHRWNQEWKNQLEILADDDIIEDSSSESEFMPPSQSNHKITTSLVEPPSYIPYQQKSSHSLTDEPDIIVIE